MVFAWRPQDGGKCKYATSVAPGDAMEGRTCFVKAIAAVVVSLVARCTKRFFENDP